MCSFCSQSWGHRRGFFKTSPAIAESVSPCLTMRTSKLSGLAGSWLALTCPSGLTVKFLGGGAWGGGVLGGPCAKAPEAVNTATNMMRITPPLVADVHETVN